MDIKKLLDQLAELYAHRDLVLMDKNKLIDIVNADKNNQIDSWLTPEIRQKVHDIEEEFAYKINDIEAEFAEKNEGLNANITDLEQAIKYEVIANGASVKGDYLHAVYTKGRTTWDTKSLDGYAVAHPEIEPFRKVGEPSVSIRKV